MSLDDDRPSRSQEPDGGRRSSGAERRSGATGADDLPPRSDKHPLNWLLLLPLLATLYPPLYNRRTPELFSIPFFYWYQLAAISIGVTCTYLVYRATKAR